MLCYAMLCYVMQMQCNALQEQMLCYAMLHYAPYCSDETVFIKLHEFSHAKDLIQDDA